MMNMMNMMKQAQNIQKKLVDAQNELETKMKAITGGVNIPGLTM